MKNKVFTALAASAALVATPTLAQPVPIERAPAEVAEEKAEGFFGLSYLGSALVAAAVVVTTIIIIDEVSDDDDDVLPTSP